MTVSTDSAAAVHRSGTRREIGERHDVSIRIDQSTGTITAEGDPTAVDAALRELASAASGPTIEIALPKDRIKRLMWRETRESEITHINRLRQLPGILSCHLDFEGAALTLTAKDESSAARAVAIVHNLIGGAEGVVTLSNSAYIGRVKGTQVSTLTQLRIASGCTEVWGPRRDSASLDFRITAPARQNLENFHARVRIIDPGALLKITGDYSISAVDKATGQQWATKSSTSSVPARPAPSPPPTPKPPVPSPETAMWPVVDPPQRADPIRYTTVVDADTMEEAISIGIAKLKATRATVNIEVLIEPEYSRILRTVKRQAKVRVTTK
jgi:hypothetical protein